MAVVVLMLHIQNSGINFSLFPSFLIYLVVEGCFFPLCLWHQFFCFLFYLPQALRWSRLFPRFALEVCLSLSTGWNERMNPDLRWANEVRTPHFWEHRKLVTVKDENAHNCLYHHTVAATYKAQRTSLPDGPCPGTWGRCAPQGEAPLS